MQRHTITLAALLLLLAACTNSTPPAVPDATAAQLAHVEPLSWWTGMKCPLQLLVNGEGISSFDVSIAGGRGVKVEAVHKAESPNYLFVDISVSPNAEPGTYWLVFDNGSESFRYAYEIAAREQTGLLAEDVRKARGIADPKEALDFLASLPPERVKAAQWSQVAVVRADLEAIVKAREATSAEKVSERTALREAVRLAQQKADPIQGMEALLKVFDSFADCDALPEAKTAFDGLVAAAQAAQRMRVEALGDRIATIAAISDPADKLAQVQACLSDWPEKRTSKALLAYAKANRHTALERLLEDDALDTLRARIERLRKEAEQVQTEAAEKPAWWVWVAIGVGALAVLYVVASALQSFLAARAEAKRKAANRAAIDSIRNTFAHRRGQR